MAVISVLQHRNLVNIFVAAACMEEDNMLIQEYMPNKCLDAFQFG